MIHYSCDRCKGTINADEELRYVVKVEIRATMSMDDFGPDEEDDRDFLLEAHEALERADDEINDAISDDVYQNRRYDLCAKCYRKFVQNPVGSDAHTRLNFSDN